MATMKTILAAILMAATAASAQPTNFADWQSNYSYPQRADLFSVETLPVSGNITISAELAGWMKMSNIVFVVDTSFSNITVTLPNYFDNTFSILNKGTNWVTLQAAAGNKFLLAPMDGSIIYSDTLVNKYALKVHTLFHINATNVVVQSEFKPLPNFVNLVTNNMVLTPGFFNAGSAASASTYLRGDNTWATPSGGGGGGASLWELDGNGDLQPNTDTSAAGGFQLDGNGDLQPSA